jgi:hypothetical protein
LHLAGNLAQVGKDYRPGLGTDCRPGSILVADPRYKSIDFQYEVRHIHLARGALKKTCKRQPTAIHHHHHHHSGDSVRSNAIGQ